MDFLYIPGGIIDRLGMLIIDRKLLKSRFFHNMALGTHMCMCVKCRLQWQSDCLTVINYLTTQ